MTNMADTTIPNKEDDIKKYKETLARNSSAQETNYLASSEQKIRSNVCIKHQDEKRISQTSGALYHFKNMFKSGNSSNKSDEEHQSVIDITTALKLRNSSTHTERSRPKEKKTKKGVFGKCKPGGCLDPTCGQDGNAYELVKPEVKAAHDTVTVVTNDYPANTAVNNTDSRGNSETKNKSDAPQQEPKIKIELYDSASLLSIFQSTKINDSYSSSIITYPPVLTTSEMQIYDEKNMKNRNSLNSYRKSFQVSQEIYFPKKANTDKKTFNPNGDIISIPSNSNLSVTRMNYSYLRAFDATASSSGGQTNVEISLASTSDDLLERALTNFDITVENIRPTCSSVNKSHKKSIDSLRKEMSNERLNGMNSSVLNNDNINEFVTSQQIKLNSNLSSKSSKLIQSKDDEGRNVDINKTSKHIEGHQSTSKVNEAQYYMGLNKPEGLSDKPKHYRQSQSKTRHTSHDQEEEISKIIIGDEITTTDIEKNDIEAPNIRKSSMLLHKSKYVLPEHRDITHLNKLSDFAIIDNTSEPIKDAETVTDDRDDDDNITKRVNPMQISPDYIADPTKGKERRRSDSNIENRDVPKKTTSSFPYQKTREQETTEYGFTNSSNQRENYINADIDIHLKSPNKNSVHTTQSSSKPFTGEKDDSKSPTLMNRYNMNSQTNSLKGIGVAYNEGSKVYGKMYSKDEMEASEKVPQELYHIEKVQDNEIEKPGGEMYNIDIRTSPFDINSENTSIKLVNEDDELNNVNEYFTGALPLQNTFPPNCTVRYVEKDDTIKGLVKYKHQIDERENKDLNKAVTSSKTSIKPFIKSDTTISIKSKYSKKNSQGSMHHLNSVEVSLNSKMQALTQKDLDNINSQYNTPKDFADLFESHEPEDHNLDLKHVNYIDPQNSELSKPVKKGSMINMDKLESLRNSEEPQPIQKYFNNEKHKSSMVYQKESNNYNNSKGLPISTDQPQHLDFSQIRNDHKSKDLDNEEFSEIQKEILETSDYSQIQNEFKRGSRYLNNEDFPEMQKEQLETSNYLQIQNEHKRGLRDLDNEKFPRLLKEQLERSDSQIQNEYKRGSRDLDNEEFPAIPKVQPERLDHSQIQNVYKPGSRDHDNEEFLVIPKEQLEGNDDSQIQNVYKPDSRDLDNEQFLAISKEQLERLDYTQIENEYKRGSRDLDHEKFPPIPKEQLERSDYLPIQNEYKHTSKYLDNEEFPQLKTELKMSDYSQMNVYKHGSNLNNEEISEIQQEQLEKSDYSQNMYKHGSKYPNSGESAIKTKEKQEKSEYSQIIDNKYRHDSKYHDNEKNPQLPTEVKIADYSQMNVNKRGSNVNNEEIPEIQQEQLEKSDYQQNMYKNGPKYLSSDESLEKTKEQGERSDYSQIIENKYRHGSKYLDNEELPEITKGQLETSDYSQIRNEHEHATRYLENEEFPQTPKELRERSNNQQVLNDYKHGSIDFDSEGFSLIPRDQREKSTYSQSSFKSKYSYNTGDADDVKEQQFIDPVDYLQESNESDSSESSKISKGLPMRSKVIDDNSVTPYSPVTSILKTNVSKESSGNVKPSFLSPPNNTNRALDTSGPFTLDDDDFQGNHGYKKMSDSSRNEKYVNELKSVNATNSRYVGGNSKEAPNIPIESRQESYSRKTPVSDKHSILDGNDVIVVDIALQRFRNKQGKRVFKSVDSATISDRDDRIVTIKSTIQPGKSMTTPIDKENYLTLTLSKRQIDTVIPVIHDDELRACSGNQLKSQQRQPRIETGKLQNVSEAKNTSRNFQCSGLPGQASVVTVPQRTLSTVYELELVPLQKVIRNLKDEIDQLAKQQELFRQKLNNKRLKIARVTNFGKTCGGCMKKTY